MEHGCEREHEAVRERWRELERERRAATRFLGGLALALAGVVGVLLGLATDACVSVGPWTHGCTAAVSPPVADGLLVFGALAVLAGAWYSRRSMGV